MYKHFIGTLDSLLQESDTELSEIKVARPVDIEEVRSI